VKLARFICERHVPASDRGQRASNDGIEHFLRKAGTKTLYAAMRSSRKFRSLKDAALVARGACFQAADKAG
jgi:hypothetical protein